MVRPQVAVGVDDPLSAFEAVADRYPVFLIRPLGRATVILRWRCSGASSG